MNAADRARYSVAGAVAALLLLLGLGAVLINLYVTGERERELLQWEARLGLVADAKADAVGRSLAEDERDLAELARNASLQLYLWQVLKARQSGESSEPAQAAYLRNLLLAAAERGGYVPGPEARIPANLPRPRTSGLALLDASLAPVSVTPGLASVPATYGAVARRALETPGKPVVDLVLDPDDRAVVVTAVAVVPVSGALASGAGPTGVVLGVRSADQELFPLLTRGPAFAEDSETLLLARRGTSVIYLSPTRDGGEPLRRSMPLSRTNLAEVAAVEKPGGFVSLPNYRGVPVLQVSRRVRGQDWVLAQQVDAGEALSAANERRTFLLATLSLLLFSIAAMAVAAWRHGSSVRARHQAEELRAKAAKLERQTDLLHTITDNVDVLTLLINRDQEIIFANRAIADAARSTIAGLVGGRLGNLFGPATTKLLAEVGDDVRRRRAPTHRLISVEFAGTSGDFQTSFIPVERIGERRQLVLLVMSDVTELKVEDQRHADQLRRLVGALSHAVDLHDPWSAHHATRMAEVAVAIARELGLPPDEQETLGLAATLANVGKIMIPSDLLTKTGPLTAADRELLHKHVEYSLELLQGLEFDGPVLDLIAQKQERLDGTGYPRGLAEGQLTLPGRILAVANAFVALVSARAYRQGLPVPEALEELLKGAGTQYDRRVIAALFHVAENRTGASSSP
jgi:HD-GYP domain-containing protein (c-di-GMP phosphodiesterase class II)